jgi:hypothetical protein
MENRDKQNPSTGSESDISKSQSQQQPPTAQDLEKGKTGTEFQDSATVQPDQPSSAQAGFGETETQQRSDIEGSSLDKKPTDEGEGGFVGSEGKSDTSSELVEDDNKDVRKDDQGAPEGK